MKLKERLILSAIILTMFAGFFVSLIILTYESRIMNFTQLPRAGHDDAEVIEAQDVEISTHVPRAGHDTMLYSPIVFPP